MNWSRVDGSELSVGGLSGVPTGDRRMACSSAGPQRVDGWVLPAPAPGLAPAGAQPFLQLLRLTSHDSY